MNECDDIEEVSSVPTTLSEYVESSLNEYVQLDRNSAQDKRYGIFYKGMRLKVRSGKTVFTSAGAAKLALYNCFGRYERRVITGSCYLSDVYAHLMDKKIPYREQVKLFREEMLRQVEIKELDLNAIN